MSGGDVAEMTALSAVGGGGGGGSAGGSSGPGSPTLNCHHPQTQFPQPRPERQRCRPTFPLLMGTVLLTLLGSAALSASIFTDYWERIDYNASAIEAIARKFNGSHRLTWLFNSTVAKIVLHPGMTAGHTSSSLTAAADPSVNSKSGSNSRSWALKRNSSSGGPNINIHSTGVVSSAAMEVDHYVNSIIDRPEQVSNNKVKRSAQEEPDEEVIRNKFDQKRSRKKRSRSKMEPSGLVYLIPLHGGIWHLCVDLQNEQLRMLQEMGLNREEACMDYLEEDDGNEGGPISRLSAHYLHFHVQSKMHNLSISCAMVCVILLGAAALLGTFGIIKRQLSAILVTGVMYILAALFAVFSLVIMHCKRNARRDTGLVDDLLVSSTDYNESRIFTNSWSMLLGWVGSLLVLLASFFWLFLAKVMRYNPLTFL